MEENEERIKNILLLADQNGSITGRDVEDELDLCYGDGSVYLKRLFDRDLVTRKGRIDDGVRRFHYEISMEGWDTLNQLTSEGEIESTETEVPGGPI